MRQLGSGVAQGGECILSRIKDLQQDMGDDEGVVRICDGVGAAQDSGSAAARGCAESGRDCGAGDLWAAAEVEENGGVQSSAGISGMGRSAAPSDDSRYGTESRMDGRGVCP